MAVGHDVGVDDEATEGAWFSSEPVHIGWKEGGAFWLPGGPLLAVFLVCSIVSSGLARLIFFVLALASLGVLILRIVILLGT
jgi:hypothetical protein